MEQLTELLPTRLWPLRDDLRMFSLRGQFYYSWVSQRQVGPPLWMAFFRGELSQGCRSSGTGCLGVVCSHFPSGVPAAPCLALSLALFVTRQQITKLSWTSEEPGPHSGTSQGTLAPEWRPLASGFGHGDLQPLAAAALPGKPPAQLRCPRKDEHCLLNSICLSNANTDPAL